MKKKNIYFAKSKNRISVLTLENMEAGFQKGTIPSCRTPLAVLNMIHQNIIRKKEKEQYTVHYRSTLMNIHLCTNVVKKNLHIIPSIIKSRYSNKFKFKYYYYYYNNTHVRLDYQTTLYTDNF